MSYFFLSSTFVLPPQTPNIAYYYSHAALSHRSHCPSLNNSSRLSIKTTQTVQRDRRERTPPPISPIRSATTVGSPRHFCLSLCFSRPATIRTPFHSFLPSILSPKHIHILRTHTPEHVQDAPSYEEMLDVYHPPPFLNIYAHLLKRTQSTRVCTTHAPDMHTNTTQRRKSH